MPYRRPRRVHPLTVSVGAVDGTFTDEVAVGAGESASVRLVARSVFLLDAGGARVHAGLSLSGDDALAGFPVWPSDAAAQRITVYP